MKLAFYAGFFCFSFRYACLQCIDFLTHEKNASCFATILAKYFTRISHEKKPPQKGRLFSSDLSGKTILIAEDIDLNRMVVAALLEETNVTVEFAENGRQAVEMFAAAPKKYATILMDIQMPEIDGYEATRLIREMKDGGEIPVIALSANSFKEDIDKSLNAGMNDHIAKPIEFEQIFSKLRRYCL